MKQCEDDVDDVFLPLPEKNGCERLIGFVVLAHEN